MMNKLFQQLNQSSGNQLGNPMIRFLQQKYQECKMMSNPSAYIQQMAQQNPQVREALTLAQQNGGDMKQVFYQLAKSKGVDPESVLNMFK